MRWRGLLTVALCVTLIGCTGGTAQTPTEYGGTVQPPANDSALQIESERVEVAVTEVVDGDTIDVRFANGSRDTVRLQGIDTPEVRADNEPREYEGIPDTDAGRACLSEAGVDAGEYVSERVEGANVTIAADPRTERRGGYDRLLAYVYVEDANLNYELVATGRARVYDTDFTFREAFDAAERRAREDSRGLWACQGE